MKPSRLHEVAIRRLLERMPHAQTKGFPQALMAALETEGVAGEFDRTTFPRPDAFTIDPVAKDVHFYEVVVRHDITDEKMRNILELWFDLDCEGWSLHLTVVNRYGFVVGELSDDVMFEEWFLHVREDDDE